MSESSTRPEAIIRWSASWWIYSVLRGGTLRLLIGGLEDTLAISGRALLLVFLLYCGVKSGAALVAPNWQPAMWLEMLMFTLQMAGLEGSIPGLARRVGELKKANDESGAARLERIMSMARVMTILTILEGVLHLFGLDHAFLKIVSGLFLLIRGFVITAFLIELAKTETQEPRILSRKEWEREQQAAQTERDQAQIIMQLQAELGQMQTELQAARTQITQMDQQAQQTITQLQADLEQAQRSLLQSAERQATLLAELQQQVTSRDTELQHVVADLQQKEQMLQSATADLQQVHLQFADLQKSHDLQTADLQTATLHLAELQTTLQTAELQFADLQKSHELQTAELQTAHLHLAELQAAHLHLAELQKPHTAPAMPAKATDPQKITSLQDARAKHVAASSASTKAKVSHEAVLAYMSTHPRLTRAQVAAELGISERKVYDAIKGQQKHAAVQ